MPPEAVNLTAAVINPSGAELRYGVSGTWERWTGTHWAGAGAWLTSLDQWGGFPVVGGAGGVIPAIGLGARSHGVGTVEYFALPPLEPGWYRLGQGGAYGIIRVVGGAPNPVPVENPRPPSLLARPTLMTGGGEVRIAGLPAGGPGPFPEQARAFNAGFAATVTVERWVGQSWTSLSSLTVHAPLSPGTLLEEVAVTLPPLDPGAYRLVRPHNTAGDLSRVIWITGDMDGITAIPVSG